MTREGFDLAASKDFSNDWTGWDPCYVLGFSVHKVINFCMDGVYMCEAYTRMGSYYLWCLLTTDELHAILGLPGSLMGMDAHLRIRSYNEGFIFEWAGE